MNTHWGKRFLGRSIKVMHYRAASGSRLFWELADVAKIIGMSEGAIARLNRDLGRTWIGVLEGYGVPAADILHSHGFKFDKNANEAAQDGDPGKDVAMDGDQPAPKASEGSDVMTVY
jgi:hypothetical protein